MQDDRKMYELRGASVAQVAQAADELWLRVRQPGSDARKAAANAGVPVDDLPEVPRAEAFALTRAQEGIDPLLTGFLVGVASGVAGNAIWSFVEKVFIPYLQHRFGRDSVEPKG